MIEKLGNMRQVLRKAFRMGDVAASDQAHRLNEHERHPGPAEYIRDFVLGGIDGIITTFAVVSGVEGANLSTSIILILGVANLIADGFSMAVGNFLGSRSEQDYFMSERAREGWEIENVPEHEIDEIREIYKKKGFTGDLLEQVVAHITSDRELWIDTMMREELNIVGEDRNAVAAAASTFAAFIVFGSVPLVVYVFAAIWGGQEQAQLFWWSAAATGLALFAVGALRAMFTLKSWIRSGLEILIVGGGAGLLSYLIGYALRSLQ